MQSFFRLTPDNAEKIAKNLFNPKHKYNESELKRFAADSKLKKEIFEIMLRIPDEEIRVGLLCRACEPKDPLGQIFKQEDEHRRELLAKKREQAWDYHTRLYQTLLETDCKREDIERYKKNHDLRAYIIYRITTMSNGSPEQNPQDEKALQSLCVMGKTPLHEIFSDHPKFMKIFNDLLLTRMTAEIEDRKKKDAELKAQVETDDKSRAQAKFFETDIYNTVIKKENDPQKKISMFKSNLEIYASVLSPKRRDELQKELKRLQEEIDDPVGTKALLGKTHQFEIQAPEPAAKRI